MERAEVDRGPYHPGLGIGGTCAPTPPGVATPSSVGHTFNDYTRYTTGRDIRARIRGYRNVRLTGRNYFPGEECSYYVISIANAILSSEPVSARCSEATD